MGIMDRSVRITSHAGPADGARARERAAHLRMWGILAVVLAILLGTSLQTWAHNDLSSTLPPMVASRHECQAPQPWLPAVPPTSPTALGAPLTVILFVLTAVAMAHGMWRWRRATALGLVLALGTFTFGTAVHAVHHLSEPGKAAECLVFSASQQVSGTLDEPCDIRASGLAISTACPDNPDVPTFIIDCSSDLPRAPPSLLS
jgi:hypothetical protein